VQIFIHTEYISRLSSDDETPARFARFQRFGFIVVISLPLKRNQMYEPDKPAARKRIWGGQRPFNMRTCICRQNTSKYGHLQTLLLEDARFH
jgi:hypothetical protein